MQHFPKNTLISLITVSDKRNFSILITNRASSGGTAGCRALALGSSIVNLPATPVAYARLSRTLIPHAPADPASPSLPRRPPPRGAEPLPVPRPAAEQQHHTQPNPPTPTPRRVPQGGGRATTARSQSPTGLGKTGGGCSQWLPGSCARRGPAGGGTMGIPARLARRGGAGEAADTDHQ